MPNDLVTPPLAKKDSIQVTLDELDALWPLIKNSNGILLTDKQMVIGIDVWNQMCFRMAEEMKNAK